MIAITENQVTLSEGVHMFVDKMWNHIIKVSNVVEELKYPTGSRESPAVSCLDIKKSHDGYQDGMYWIDPNQGGVGDAIEVWCNMTGGGQTCVQPETQSSEAELKQWSKRGEDSEWFSEIEGGFEITYNDQIASLAMKSDIATQTFVFNCDGVPAWFDQSLQSTGNAIALLGLSEYLFETADLDGLTVLQDGCKDKSNGQTVFQIKTKSSRLPVIDFMPKDYGKSNQKFGFRAGAVCFL